MDNNKILEGYLDETTKKETATKLGISQKLLEEIYNGIKRKHPNYSMGYEYKSIRKYTMNGI